MFKEGRSQRVSRRDVRGLNRTAKCRYCHCRGYVHAIRLRIVGICCLHPGAIDGSCWQQTNEPTQGTKSGSVRLSMIPCARKIRSAADLVPSPWLSRVQGMSRIVLVISADPAPAVHGRGYVPWLVCPTLVYYRIAGDAAAIERNRRMATCESLLVRSLHLNKQARWTPTHVVERAHVARQAGMARSEPADAIDAVDATGHHGRRRRR